MVAIKAYTDLSQSKTLSKILPLESADGGWYGTDNPLAANTEYWLYTKYTEKAALPAWSLTALLSVLPKNLNIGRPSLVSNYKGCYWIQYYDEFMKPNNYKTECFNNPVEACVAMIESLHEQKLL